MTLIQLFSSKYRGNYEMKMKLIETGNGFSVWKRTEENGGICYVPDRKFETKAEALNYIESVNKADRGMDDGKANN